MYRQAPKKGLSGFIHSLLVKQPVETPVDPVRRQFDATKSQFIQQQGAFRSVVEETLQKLERQKGQRDAGDPQ